MRYTVTIPRTLHYDISDDNLQALGTMLINVWWPMKAKISTPSDSYEIAPIGFWQVSREILRNGLPFARLNPKIGRGFQLSFENSPTLFIRKKSIWRSSEFVVTDYNESVVGNINVTFRLKGFNFHYDIELDTYMLDKETTAILPFLLVYSARLMRQRHAAAG